MKYLVVNSCTIVYPDKFFCLISVLIEVLVTKMPENE